MLRRLNLMHLRSSLRDRAYTGYQPSIDPSAYSVGIIKEKSPAYSAKQRAGLPIEDNLIMFGTIYLLTILYMT